MVLKHITVLGNNLLAEFEDGTKQIAYATGNSIWLAGSGGNPPDPEPPVDGDFIWPSDFNPTTYFWHSGLDFPDGYGTPVPVIANGTVTQAGWSSISGLGNTVTVSHGSIDGVNVSSLYAHLSSVSVSVGDTVTVGQSVGGTGATGGDYAVHRHIEVIFNGQRRPNSTRNAPSGWRRALEFLRTHAGNRPVTYNGGGVYPEPESLWPV